jgi:hypothetical protein
LQDASGPPVDARAWGITAALCPKTPLPARPFLSRSNLSNAQRVYRLLPACPKGFW